MVDEDLEQCWREKSDEDLIKAWPDRARLSTPAYALFITEMQQRGIPAPISSDATEAGQPGYSSNAPRIVLTEKSLALAIGLNVLWAGAGYIYYGRVALGIILMILIPVLAFMTSGLIWVGFLVIMIIDLIIMNNKHKKAVEAATTKKCPNCAEFVKVEAKICRFCNSHF